MDYYEDSNGNKILNLNSIFQVGDSVDLKINNGIVFNGNILSYINKDNEVNKEVEIGIIIKITDKEIFNKSSNHLTTDKEILPVKFINFMELMMRFLIIIYLGLILNLLYKTTIF